MKVGVAQWQSVSRAGNSRRKNLCCGEGRRSFAKAEGGPNELRADKAPADGSQHKGSGVVKVRVTSTQESTRVKTGEVAVSKTACFARGSSSNNLRGPSVPAGKEEHSQEWLCWKARMAQCRDTSLAKERG